MWAASYVINTSNFDMLDSSQSSGYAKYNGTHTINGVSIVSNQVMINSSSLQFQKNAGYIYNSTAMPGNITKITLGTASNFTIYVGTSANPNATTATSGTAISGNYTFFAVKANSSTATTATITIEYSSTYSVTYDANDATSGTVPVDANVYTDNADVTVLGNTGSLTKTGCTFGGWNTKSDGTGTTYAAGATFKITDNATLYAKWDGNLHTVTLPAEDSYGRYTMNVSNDVAYGTEVTLTYTHAYGYNNYVAKWYMNGVLLAGNTFTMPDEDVTITVDVIENPDYATLPFAWAGGASESFIALDGVSASGLGADYGVTNSPYLVKLDGTGDFITIKTDGQPGKLTVGVKMIGGNNTSSIKVQESADGETFDDLETLSISGSQNAVLTLATTKAFAATSRYIKLLFTKGSNVGVGPISLYKSINAATDYTPIAMNSVDLTMYRSFVAGWNGIVLPFDLTTAVKATLGATEVKTMSAASESAGTITLTFTDAELPVAAGTPVLVKLDDVVENPSFENVNLETTTPTTVEQTAGGSTFTLTGTYSSADLQTSEAYFVSGDKFYHKAAGVNLTAAPFRAYIVQTGAAPSRVLFNLEGETTGIGEKVAVDSETADAPVYNLAGQRVAQPTRGLYIVNGKKIVVK